METLKISELSVGDWVGVQFPDGDEWIGRVASVSNAGGLEIQCSNKILRCTANFLKPIPITAEILEKNGFERPNKQVWRDTWGWTNKEDTLVELSAYKDNCYMRVVQLIDGIQKDRTCGIALHYVHELQKILRLAGVEKEINL